MQNECLGEREGWGHKHNFNWGGWRKWKGELEVHRYPASDGRCGEKREGIHRAWISGGQQVGRLWRPHLGWTGYGEGPWGFDFSLQWGRQSWACSPVSCGWRTWQNVALGLPSALFWLLVCARGSWCSPWILLCARELKVPAALALHCLHSDFSFILIYSCHLISAVGLVWSLLPVFSPHFP